MVLNRNEQKQLEGIFTPDTLQHSFPWNGRYGTRFSSWTAEDFHQHHWASETMTNQCQVDMSTYRLGIDNGPDWKKRKADHNDVGTQFAATAIKVKRHSRASYYLALNPFHADQTDAYGWIDPAKYSGQSYYNYVPLYDTSLDVTIDNLAINKLYKKISAEFDGASFLGELRETVTMLRHPLEKLQKAADYQIKRSRMLRAKIVKDARNRRNWPGQKLPHKTVVNRHALATWRKAAASSFLEWRWGMSPLMSDIEGLFENLKRKLDQPSIDRVSSGASMYYALPDVNVTDGAYSVSADVNITTVCHTAVSYQAAIYSQLNSESDTSRVLNIAPLDWIPAAWEVFPQSWLYDYFFNIGDILNAAVMATRIRFVYISKTVKHTLNSRIVITPVRPSAQYFEQSYIKGFQATPGEMFIEKKHVSRNPQYSMPLPSFQFHGFLSPGKAMNLTAYAGIKGEGAAFKNRMRL